MAHSALHFSIGMAVGSAATLHGVARAWLARANVADPIGKWLLISYGLGIYAILPSLFRWCGVPETVTSGWWMNVFLLHPFLTGLKAGGMIPAGFAILLCFVIPYALILAALWRKGRGILDSGNLRFDISAVR